MSEFAQHFDYYCEIAQREPVAVTSHRRRKGYFVSVIEFEETERLTSFAPRSRPIADVTVVEIKQITASRMSHEHDHLNALLDEE